MKVIRPETIDDTSLTSTNVAETDEAVWNNSTAYIVGDLVMITTPNVHTIYECSQAHTGQDPTTTEGYWLNTGATNAWKMFDESIGNPTVNADTIDVSIVPGRVNSIAVLEVDCTSIQVIMTDPTHGEVYNHTETMTSNSGITDWYSYYFEPIVRKRDLVLFDLPLFASATVRVIIDFTGSDAQCGKLVLGLFKFLGLSKYGLQSGIRDYSRKEEDTFGNVSILKRRFAKTSQADLHVENTAIDGVFSTLVDYRSTAVVWAGTDNYSMTIVYGFFIDFNVVIAGFSHSECNLELEGLA